MTSQGQATSAATAPRRQRLPLLTAAFVALACLSMLAAEGWQIVRARQTQLSDASIDAQNLAKSVAQHAYDTLKEADTSLADLVDRVELGDAAHADGPALHALLERRSRGLPQIQGLFLFGPDGSWIANSLSPQKSALNNSDRDYFKHHKSSPDRGPHIGPPIQSKTTHEWVVTLSRRIDRPDGSFGGVALASVKMSYFKAFYDGFDIGAQGSILVATDAGRLFLRRPLDEAQLNRDLSKSQLFSRLLPASPSGTVSSVSAIDGVERIMSYRRVADYPLVVSAALSKEEVLEGWRADSLLHGGVVSLMAGGLALVGIFIYRQTQRRARAESALLLARASLQELNRGLELQAMQDSLTGLANRRRLDLALSEAMALSQATGAPVGLAMVDVDHFKRFNDLLGHAAGDDCLRAIGAAIRAACSSWPGAIAARYGGEEMAVLLPGASLAQALAIAESARAAVHALAIAHPGSPFGRATISAGVHSASAPPAGSDTVRAGLDLILAADKALYAAKEAGRDRAEPSAGP